MIQHLIKPTENENPASQARSLIEQGARWLTLRMPAEATDSEIADAIRQIIPLCSQAEAIFVVEGHPQLVLQTTAADGETRSGGVVVSAAHGHPAHIRNLLGPHAIIGYAAASAAEILPLAGLDIDYFTLPASAYSPELDSVEIPIVATGTDTLPQGFSAILKEF